MEKRNWISIIGKTLLVTFMLMSTLSNAQCKKDKYIGLQLYSVRDDIKKDLKGTIEAVGKMGYKFVEAAGYGDGKFYGMEPEEFKALIEANGMELVGSHSGIHLTGKKKSFEKAMAWWDDCIDAHKRAGVKYIVKPSMGGYPYESLEALKKNCDYFNAVGEKCNAAGLRFGYHNHANEFKKMEGTDVVVYDFMLENTDADKVMFQLDLYWIYKGGKNAIDYFNKYPGRFENFHMKDVAELGDSGEIDFKAALNKAKKAGVQYLVVEVERYNFTPLESVKKSFDYLNNAKFVKACYSK
jgi:sugar phosphate isomerase/epimerase